MYHHTQNTKLWKEDISLISTLPVSPIGTKLQLRREEDNKFAPYAVAIYYKDYKLGFIPRDKNKEISKLCEQGYTGIFEARINRISQDEHPENQIGVIIYIKKCNDNK